MNAVSHGLSISRTVAGWGLRLYLRHFVIIFGLALLPTIQRFVVVNWGEALPEPVNIGSEIATLAARIALLAFVARIAIVGDRELSPLDWDERASRAARFIGANKGAALVLLAVLAAALVVFKFLPELAIAQALSGDDRDTATAIMLAVKNPVIITFTLIWVIGIIRHMMITGAATPQREPSMHE